MHPPARILQVYIQALTGFGHVCCIDGLNNTLFSECCALENSFHCGNGGQNIYSKDRQRGKEGASNCLGPACGSTWLSHCLVDLPQQFSSSFWCIELCFSCSCFTHSQCCGSVSPVVLCPCMPGMNSLLETARAHGAPSCGPPSEVLHAPCLQWPLQTALPVHTCPPASAHLHPGEVFPAHLGIVNQLCPGQPRDLHHPVGCNHFSSSET